MHQALLIDEIVRCIFDFCYEEERSILPVAARTCKAWKEPALDRLWRSLPSLEPLLRLYPHFPIQLNEANAPDNLQSYARRVRDITLRGNSLIINASTTLHPSSALPSIKILQNILPNLIKSRILPTCHNTQVTYALSTRLRHLTIDIGFKSTPKGHRLASSIGLLLQDVAHLSRDLKCLSLRGLISMDLGHTLGSMNQLRVLSLRIGDSLTVDMVMKILLFPRLEELQIHAEHLNAEELDLSSMNASDRLTFPSLAKLNIRATVLVIEFFLRRLQPNTLNALRVEAEDRLSWVPIFQLLSEKVTYSLQEFSLEHLVDLEEFILGQPEPHEQQPDTNSESGDNDPNGPSNVQPSQASPALTTNLPASAIQEIYASHLLLSVIRHLKPIRSLRRLVFDTSLPLKLSDDDIKDLVCWWPELEHLELGSFCSSLPINLRHMHGMTTKSLEYIAANLKGLRRLVIPVNLTFADEPPREAPAPSTLNSGLPVQTALERLTIAFPGQPNEKLALLLKCLFPNLRLVDGLPEQEEQWHRLQIGLWNLM